MTKVVMLGCLTIKDDSVKELAKHLTYLEDLDLGGTSITSESLFELVGNCLNLRKVNISGCKKLNASDDTILKKHKINVESGEDIFRFHLFPLAGTELPEITKSVLKTRGSLSMNKVYIYLIKKLAAEKALEESLLDQPADHFIEILCNGVTLNTFIQLRSVREQFWAAQPADQLLILNYRRKDEQPGSQLKARAKYEKARFHPRKPPMWVPKHLCLECSSCRREYKFLLRTVHWCRLCGLGFCSDCSNNFLPIP